MRQYFYREDGELKKYRYCSYCSAGPFKESEESKGVFFNMGTTGHPLTACRMCAAIKFPHLQEELQKTMEQFQANKDSSSSKAVGGMSFEEFRASLDEEVNDLEIPDNPSWDSEDPDRDDYDENGQVGTESDPVREETVPESELSKEGLVPEPEPSKEEPAAEEEFLRGVLKPAVASGQKWHDKDRRRDRTVEIVRVEGDYAFYIGRDKEIKISVDRLIKRWELLL